MDKVYFASCSFAASVLLVILLMFLVQFRVENLQDEIAKTESEIIAFEDEIQLLEVEWVYLTRPERLRSLASRYLKDSGYALASQVKNDDQMEKFYLVNYQKTENSSSQESSEGAPEKAQDNRPQRVSF